MPQYHLSWMLDEGAAAEVVDVETAVKNGILGGGAKVELKKMVVEELESSAAADDIPAVFICPISLESMTDPVTLCTGQTYERDNILRWFATGRLTCPTTMQDLWDGGAALTPNRTLHHLITAWFSQRHLRLTKRADDVGGRAADLLFALRRVKGQALVQALSSLRRLVAAHPSARSAAAANTSGGAAFLASLLGPFTSHAVGSEAVGILVHLPLDSSSIAALLQPAKISFLVNMLNEGTIDTKINCTKLIEMLLPMADDFRTDVVSSPSLLVGLLRLVKDKRHPNGLPAGLNLLRSICAAHEPIRNTVVSIGAVPQLIELLPGLSPECLESALCILGDVAALPEGRSALKDCPHTIPNVVRLPMRVSEQCVHHALSILWAVCKLAPDECASLAVEAGLAARLLLVIQSGCNPALKQRSAELLKLCSLSYTGTHFISKCKLTRTIQ